MAGADGTGPSPQADGAPAPSQDGPRDISVAAVLRLADNVAQLLPRVSRRAGAVSDAVDCALTRNAEAEGVIKELRASVRERDAQLQQRAADLAAREAELRALRQEMAERAAAAQFDTPKQDMLTPVLPPAALPGPAPADGSGSPGPRPPQLWVRAEDAVCFRMAAPSADADADASDLLQLAVETFTFAAEANGGGSSPAEGSQLRASQLRLCGPDGTALSNRKSLASVLERGGGDPANALIVRRRGRAGASDDGKSEANTVRSYSPSCRVPSAELRQRAAVLEQDHQALTQNKIRMQRELSDALQKQGEMREQIRRLELELRRERDRTQQAQSVWGRPAHSDPAPGSAERRSCSAVPHSLLRADHSPPSNSPRAGSPRGSISIGSPPTGSRAVARRQTAVQPFAPPFPPSRAHAASPQQQFAPGEVVECRDRDDKVWLRGVVQKGAAGGRVLVLVDGWKKPFRFREVRREVIWSAGEAVRVCEDAALVKSQCMMHPKIMWEESKRALAGCTGTITRTAAARSSYVRFADGQEVALPNDCLRKLEEEQESPTERTTAQRTTSPASPASAMDDDIVNRGSGGQGAAPGN